MVEALASESLRRRLKQLRRAVPESPGKGYYKNTGMNLPTPLFPYAAADLYCSAAGGHVAGR